MERCLRGPVRDRSRELRVVYVIDDRKYVTVSSGNRKVGQDVSPLSSITFLPHTR